MCGRFTLRTNASTLARIFGIAWNQELAVRWNIAPTQKILAIREPLANLREGVELKWGLIPSWAKDTILAATMINARAETLREKPAFRTAFQRRRCLIPVDGFYEWKRNEKSKTPYLIQMRECTTFAFAGLWENWRDPEGQLVESCTIITTTPNELMATIHDRMPVILNPADYQRWLNPNIRHTDELQSLLVPCSSDSMTVVEVSSSINSSRNEIDPRF